MRFSATVACVLVAAVASQSACAPKDPTVWLKPGDKSLDRPIAEARATLPIFWRHVDDDPKVEDAAVKIGFPDAHGGTEFLWVTVEGHSAVAVRGRIGNQPDDVPDVHEGDPYVGRVSDIVDWAYRKGDEGYGQFTSRELVRQGAFKEQSQDLAPTPLEAADR